MSDFFRNPWQGVSLLKTAAMVVFSIVELLLAHLFVVNLCALNCQVDVSCLKTGCQLQTPPVSDSTRLDWVFLKKKVNI